MGALQVLIHDVQLRVQAAVSPRAGPGEMVPIGEGPKDRIPPQLFSYGLALAQDHWAAWALGL